MCVCHMHDSACRSQKRVWGPGAGVGYRRPWAAWHGCEELNLDSPRKQCMSLTTVHLPSLIKLFFRWSCEASPELRDCKNLLASVFWAGAGDWDPSTCENLGLCYSPKAISVDGRSNVKMETQTDRVHCWRTSHVSEGGLSRQWNDGYTVIH